MLFPFKIGGWVVTGGAGKDKWNAKLFMSICPKCNEKKARRLKDIKRINMCCKCSNSANKSTVKHGLTGSKEYYTWQNMRTRCVNKNRSDYKYYGGKGIRVCEKWNKFENFFEDMGKAPGKAFSIDRIDPIGDYCKSNCKWVTHKENSKRRNNQYLYISKEKLKLIHKECLYILGLSLSDLDIPE